MTEVHCANHNQYEYDCIDCDDARNGITQASPRATAGALNVIITAVPHKTQRYDTCGDWYEAPAFWEQMGATKDRSAGCLHVRVSAELPRKEQFLVAIHELIEAFLCEVAGVTEEQVDGFDFGYNLLTPNGGKGEPGDEFLAPYYHQHQIATAIERILAAEVQVNWLEYEQHIEELSR
jgi:hypothetical protein